ncbi:short-chain dehydrogenase [Pseudozyma hubeiensis SY62]|uniref:Short-chain dehydrogenase n=1 Tax=Pseudozyma hubeiensis (strain SY62) TaxID=1305764 RepID=R9PIE4_PSEHS|nr:short-chain dehydrogenase [Pseudozyma hubeiensis SY62]GAC97845.1 short-chain dehydrogenase [Pseudozyma hubeiensis SY62]
MATRSEASAKAAIREITTDHPHADIHFLQLDLAQLTSVQRCAEEFLSKESRLDVLLNNAGIMATPYMHTKDGLELQFGTNVMGHYLLTMLLLPTLIKTSSLHEHTHAGSATVRIVQIASVAHKFASSDTSFEHLDAVNKQHWPEFKGTWNRYGKSKTANILMANELPKYFPAGARVRSLSLDPGHVRTGLRRAPAESLGFIGPLLLKVANAVSVAPEQGALTQLYACTSPEADRLGRNETYLVPVAKLGKKSPLAADSRGVLGGDLFRFCNRFIKDKLGLSVTSYLSQAGVTTPAEHCETNDS